MDYIEQDGLSPQSEQGLDFRKLFQNKFNLIVVGLVVVGVILLAIGAWFFVGQKSGSSSEDIKIIATTNSTDGQILVHVDGAVAKPGVYKLSSNSRVNDAVEAAGGLANNADRSRINLAAKLTDGQKVYVPSYNDTVSSGSSLRILQVNDTVSSNYQAGLVDINTASQAELEALPAVGPVTAQKIIKARPYASLDELVGKKAVGRSTFEKIKELVSL